MSYRMSEISQGVYVGKMPCGSLDVEIWEGKKPPHATTRDYAESCQEVVIPADAVDALFEFLR